MKHVDDAEVSGDLLFPHRAPRIKAPATTTMPLNDTNRSDSSSKDGGDIQDEAFVRDTRFPPEEEAVGSHCLPGGFL